jgi:hypothetical protein
MKGQSIAARKKMAGGSEVKGGCTKKRKKCKITRCVGARMLF